MEIIFSEFFINMHAAGLDQLWQKILIEWVTPIFFALIAFFAFTFFKDRKWSKVIGFVGIALVIGILVFNAQDFFGQNGRLTKIGTEFGKTINTVNVVPQVNNFLDFDLQ